MGRSGKEHNIQVHAVLYYFSWLLSQSQIRGLISPHSVFEFKHSCPLKTLSVPSKFSPGRQPRTVSGALNDRQEVKIEKECGSE